MSDGGRRVARLLLAALLGRPPARSRHHWEVGRAERPLSLAEARALLLPRHRLRLFPSPPRRRRD